MNTAKLIKLIQESILLSEAERVYWLKNLPSMTPKQCQKLWNILNVEEEMPFQKEIQQYVEALGQAAETALKQSGSAMAA